MGQWPPSLAPPGRAVPHLDEPGRTAQCHTKPQSAKACRTDTICVAIHRLPTDGIRTRRIASVSRRLAAIANHLSDPSLSVKSLVARVCYIFLMPKRLPPNIADQLREAISKSGESANEIAKASGVAQTTVSRFLRGEDMSFHRAAKIAAYLGLQLQGLSPPSGS